MAVHDSTTSEAIVRIIELGRVVEHNGQRGLSGLSVEREVRLDPARTRPVMDALITVGGGFDRPDLGSQKDQAPGGVAFNAQHALRLLADIPRLIEEATAQERLALVRLTPQADVGPVLAALVQVLGGVPDGLQVLHLKPGLVPSLLWTPSRLAA